LGCIGQFLPATAATMSKMGAARLLALVAFCEELLHLGFKAPFALLYDPGGDPVPGNRLTHDDLAVPDVRHPVALGGEGGNLDLDAISSFHMLPI